MTERPRQPLMAGEPLFLGPGAEGGAKGATGAQGHSRGLGRPHAHTLPPITRESVHVP